MKIEDHDQGGRQRWRLQGFQLRQGYRRRLLSGIPYEGGRVPHGQRSGRQSRVGRDGDLEVVKGNLARDEEGPGIIASSRSATVPTRRSEDSGGVRHSGSFVHSSSSSLSRS